MDDQIKCRKMIVIFLAFCLLLPINFSFNSYAKAEPEQVEPEWTEIVDKTVGIVMAGNDDGGALPLQPYYFPSMAAFDYRERSIGTDLGSIRDIVKVELWNQANYTTTRQTEEYYEVYISNDNISYQLIDNWGFAADIKNGRIVHSFSFDPGLKTRYIKFHSLHSDDAATFVIGNADSLKIFAPKVDDGDNQLLEITDKTVGIVMAGNDDGGTLPLQPYYFPSMAAFDYRERSIGANLGSLRNIVKVELWNQPNYATTRQTEEYYEVYISNDNISYQLVDNWGFAADVKNGRIVHTFSFDPGLKTRYIKFHSLHSDDAATFVIGNADSLKIFTPKLVPSDGPLYEISDKAVGIVLGTDIGGAVPLQPYRFPSVAAFDYRERSIGADLGSLRDIVKVELWNQPNYTTTRQSEEYYEVYVSEDNDDYRLITDWAFQAEVRNGRIVHTFVFNPAVEAQYIKFHTLHNDNKFSFVFAGSEDIRIFASDDPNENPGNAGENSLVGISTRNGYVLKKDDGSLQLSLWDYAGAVALDYQNRSVGSDLGGIRNIAKVELLNRGTATRQQAKDYEVYVSDDNITYRLLSQWTLSEERRKNFQLAHVFDFENGVNARYIKIRSLYNDDLATFVIDKLQKDLIVFINQELPGGVMTEAAHKTSLLLHDTAPLTGTLTNWETSEQSVVLDANEMSIGIDIGKKKILGRLELWDNDKGARIKRSDYEIYASNDNVIFERVNYWLFSSEVVAGRLTHRIDFPSGLEFRYVKIKTGYADASGGTFTLANIKSDLKAFLSPRMIPITPTSMEVAASIRTGFVYPDSSPLTTAVVNWGDPGELYLDESLQSLGIDLGVTKPVYAIQWRDSDAITRLEQSDYTLYGSMNNVKYEPLQGGSFSAFTLDGRLYHRIDFPVPVSVRYLKIHQAYNDTDGTFLLFDPQHDLMAFTERLTSELAATVGYADEDSNPTSGQIANWGTTSSLLLDEPNRSVGIDLQYNRDIGAIELRSAAATRMDKEHYRIYQSDNNEDYSLVNDWAFTAGNTQDQVVHRLNFTDLNARYLKITSIFDDGNGTFQLLNPQEGIAVYSAPVETKLPSISGIIDEDSNPQASSLQEWGERTGTVDLNISGRSVGVDLGLTRQVSKLEMWTTDSSSEMDRSNFVLYSSDDNMNFNSVTHLNYQVVPINGQMVYLFEFSGVRARYLKVHVESGTGEGSINLGNFQADIRAFLITGQQPEQLNSLPAVIGYLSNDIAPGSGTISNWGYTGEFHFDQKLNSLVADLGEDLQFNQIILFDSDHDTRLRKTDLSIYVSSDNIVYTKLDEWDMRQQDYRIVLYNLSAEARYVKVHQHYDTKDPTFAARGGNMQLMLTVMNTPPDQWTFGGNQKWKYRKAIQVNNTMLDAVYDRAVYISDASLAITDLIAEGKMKPNRDDVRFVSAGKELHYYKADGGFYVRIPSLPASGNRILYMYYGNDKAENVSDGLNTFQVEYGNRTITRMKDVAELGQIKSISLSDGSVMQASNGVDDIYIRKSYDHGQTWDEPRMIVNMGGKEWMGSLVVMSTGEIVLPFVQWSKYQATDCLTVCSASMYVVRSLDNGTTWSAPSKIDSGWNYNGILASPIELDNGDLVLPFHYVYTNSGGSRISAMYSTDRGLTWTKSESDIGINGDGYEGGSTEPNVVQLSDGTIKMLFRTQTGGTYRFGESTSTDNGRTWSAASESIIYSSNTFPALKKHNGDVLLLWAGNNVFGMESYNRTPLNLAYSSDNMSSWHGYRDVLARTSYHSPDGQQLYLQPDMVVTADGSAILSYAYKMTDYYDLRIEDFDQWLYRSHGGYSGFDSADLHTNYWWQLSDYVKVSFARKYSGTGSLQLNAVSANGRTESIRSFGTGIRQGKVKFKLYAENLASGFVATLKESYSNGLDALGSMFQLYVTPEGELKYRNSSGEWTPLQEQAQLELNQWHDIEIRFDTDADSAEVLLDGTSKGSIGYFRNENIINYLQVSSADSTMSGTNVFIDDLIIQDLSVSMPSVGSIGKEKRVKEQGRGGGNNGNGSGNGNNGGGHNGGGHGSGNGNSGGGNNGGGHGSGNGNNGG